MSTRPKRARPTPSPAPPPTLAAASDVTAVGGTLSGRLGPAMAGTALALVWEGVVVGSAKAGPDGGFALPLPSWTCHGTVDVLSVATGRSVLATPHPLDPARSVTGWTWALEGGAIAGRFRLEDAPAGPLLVQAVQDGVVYAQAFAQPGADKEFAFTAALRRLIPMGPGMMLRPRVAGALLPDTLAVLASDVGTLGHLDATDGVTVSGWAVDLRDPSRRIAIDLRIDGATILTTVADGVRADLKQLGWSDGASGFIVGLPPGTDRTRPGQLHAYVAGTDIELVGSPLALPVLPAVIGSFDAVEGPFAGGWAVNMRDPATPVALEAVCDGEVIGTGVANLYRGDVEAAGMPTPWCGFRFLLDRPLTTLFDREISLQVAGSALALTGSPRQITQNMNIKRFLGRAATIPPRTMQRLIHRMSRQTEATLISIVMPVYNTPADWLIEALNSVLGQWSGQWQLICVDDASPAPHVAAILDTAARHDPRIHVIRMPSNGGIAAATNAGIRAAAGAYVTFLDHDDVIEPDAVHKLAMAAQTTGADLIYSDEAITTDDITSVIEVRARPAFSHDYYLSHPYFVHMVCVRTALAQRLGGWDETLTISADVDFVLRVIEGARAVAHVPSVLYRWRTHAGSAGHAGMEQVTDTMITLLERHLARLGRTASVRPGFRYNEYRVDWADDGGEVLIVIPTRNRVDLLQPCIESIERTSKGGTYRIVVIDHQSTDKATVRYLKRIAARHTIMPYSGIFNYALMNNLAVKTHGGTSRHILFLNNDVEAIEDGWIERMRTLSARPEVGAVGPLLLYGDDRVQHAGVLMAFAGAADHAMKFHAAYLGKGQRHPGYNCNLTTVRDYSAVTAACVMIRAEVFQAVGGFDERFVIGFNDTDLCLRIVEAGFKVLYDGFTVLYHHESATRTQSKSVDHPEDDARLRTRWVRYFREGDPFYSPLLAAKGTDHQLRQDPGCKGLMNPRVVTLPQPAPAAPAPKPARRRRMAKA